MEFCQTSFSGDAFRAAGITAVETVAEYLATIRDRPVYQQVPTSHRQHLMDMPLPEQGEDLSNLINRFASEIMPYPMGNGHPRFFGWVNSPPRPAGIIAEFLAAALDPSCAGGDHAATYLERCVTRWLAELVGFPLDGGIGALTSGGSMASLTAIATARHAAAMEDGWNDREDGVQGAPAPMTMYLSTEAHTTMVKAAELLGIGSRHVRRVPVDDDLRLDVAALRSLVVADREAGYRPFLVAASAGTVSTGAIDPFEPLADFCAEQGLWLHVDGAYGAVGGLDDRVADQYAGMDRADSLALDPHKWLSVPVECGCVLMRDAAMARDAFSLVPAYLRTEENKGSGGLPWFSEYGFQQTRGFRALKVWMCLAVAGRQGVTEAIRRNNDIARMLAHRVETMPELELYAAPTLSIVCFRVRASDSGARDELNKRVMEEVQSSGRAFVTQAAIGGAFWLRANVMHFDTTEADIGVLLDTVVEVAGEVLAGTISKHVSD